VGTKELKLSEPTRYLRRKNLYGPRNKLAFALLEAKRKIRKRVYSLILRLQILQLDLRSFSHHIGTVFSKELYTDRSNLVLGLLSVSNKRHLCQIEKDDRNCGICILLTCYPKASFLEARLFLDGFLQANESSLAEVRDMRDFCRKRQVPHEGGR